MNMDIVDIDENVINAVTLEKIAESSKNIAEFLEETPIVTIDAFNKLFGHDLFFKLENLQKTGSFKVRGVINVLCNLKKNNNLPEKIVTYSSGNHGLALAWASKIFGIKEVKVYLPEFSSEIKKELIKKYGAKVVITKTRTEAEKRAEIDAVTLKYKLITPSESNDIISGIATVAYEALQKQQGFDAIFFPIGGGSLSSSTLLVKNYLSPTTRIYAGEPREANDAFISHKTGKLFRSVEEALHTIADGATALGITKKIFNYVKHLDGIYEISEEEILYWTAQFHKFSKNFCEPTSALALAAAYRWIEIQEDEERKKILIIITGSNISDSTKKEILQSKYLDMKPDELKLHR